MDEVIADTIKYLENQATKLDQMRITTEAYGWSTVNVDTYTSMANENRRVAAVLRRHREAQ